MKTEYNGYALAGTPNPKWFVLRHLNQLGNENQRQLGFSLDQLEAIHILSGPILGCSDENCACHEAGRQKGLETPREPQGSRA